MLKNALTNGNLIYVRSVSAIQIAERELYAVFGDRTVLPGNSTVGRQAEGIRILATQRKLVFRKREGSALEWTGQSNQSRVHRIRAEEPGKDRGAQ